jgi:hypothetical protein
VTLHRHVRLAICAFLTLIGFTIGFGGSVPLLRAQDAAPVPDAQGLKIAVITGEDGVNIVKKKSAVRPVVEVRDKNDLPVAGASVIFLLPGSGASATFNGSRSLTVLTNSAGRATVSGMKPVGSGVFKIQVTASFHGQTASAAISQTNYVTVAAAHAAGASAAGGTSAGGLSAGAVAAIVGGVAAAAAVGIVVGTRGGSKTTTTQGTISLGTGTVVFGPPH